MSTYTSQSQVARIAHTLSTEKVTASDFILTLLEQESLKDHECTADLLDNAQRIVKAFSQNSGSTESMYAWARQTIQTKTTEAIKLLTANDAWHFNAEHASASDLEDFKIEQMAGDMKTLAPDLWALLQILFSRDEIDIDGDQVMADLSEVDEFDESGEFAGGGKHAKAKRRERMRNIKTAIRRAIHSLSAETVDTLRDMGQTLLVGYAYDNFDINFPTLVPTIEKAADPLTHLTSGALIYLEHGVVREDLECSEELWKKSPLNPYLPARPSQPSHNLNNLHPEADHPSGLTRRERWNAWKFQSDLYEHGDPAFSSRLEALTLPESVEQIPIVKMRYAPARSMDINQSTHAGNISAVENLLSQGGVGALPSPLNPLEKDPAKIAQFKRTRQLVSVLKYIVLFFGDLGTYERVQGVLLRRSIEGTPWLRHQFMVFVMGFFHLKMACADAIWRIFIEPKQGRLDQNSLMAYVTQIRPRETGKIGSNPGFRRMHEVIRHIGIVLRLDAWRVEAQRRNPAWTSLEIFAKARPSEQLISDMANHLAAQYVAGGDVDILRRAVRLNSPVNPTETIEGFRGVDWVEESMINLYTKHTFGGSGSNDTKARVIEESTLIKIYHSCHRTIERNFGLTELSRRHAPPNMKKTFEKMLTYLREQQPNEHKAGRTSTHNIPDMLDKGQHIVYNIADRSVPEDDSVDQSIEDEDLAVEHT
ncbi:hypothetical protein MSAN_01499400 [Mycena sanguinolenta]|uniref:DUF6589 domain-containing protein n=1 Tax=Mycena sanguinolenta TaxID=230812 RepID=A0A8H6Y7P7_9AGAR|nr:hypothetical protein MSAN_01499400 [Mycena sanguinolenta]